jgi:predicted TIM-barrel fold metal-dependent hydrolase
MAVIDADTHVLECDATWDYLDADAAQFRPQKGELHIGEATRPFWAIDGLVKIRSQRTEPHWRAMGELTDVPARLKDMDEMGVDVQIIYPTSFGPGDFPHPEVELALTRSYNRWLAERCAESGGRLRWIMIPPLQSLDKAAEEMRFARDHGAVGVLKKGDEQAGHWSTEPYFFPLYEEAQRLDMPICFHVGTGYQGAMPFERIAHFGFYRVHLGVVHAFQSLLSHQVPSKFPSLRWGFVEATASFVPFVMYNLRRMLEQNAKRPGNATRFMAGSDDYQVQRNVLTDNNLYVSCQVDEDLPYIIQCVGDDNLMVGSDYTHQDAAQELEFISALSGRVRAGEINASAMRKMTQDNPSRFYGL